MDGDCSRPAQWWARVDPRPFAALVWLPLMLIEPTALLLGNPVGLLAVLGLAASCVGAVLAAHGRRAWPAWAVPLLLTAQAAFTLFAAAQLADAESTWLWVLLSITVGAAAPARWGAYGLLGASVLAGCWLGHETSAGQGVGSAFTVGISAIGTFAVYRLFDAVAELNRTRTQLAEAAVSQERERFSRDLHDLLGHSLSLIVVKSEAVRRFAGVDPEASAEHARDIEGIARDALAEVRQAVAGYRGNGFPVELDNAVETLRSAGIRPEIDVEPAGAPLAPVDPVLGWVLREAVTNVVRHSAAGRCTIRLRTGASGVRLTVHDDGTSGALPTPGSGIASMQRRVEDAGGRLEVTSGVDGRGVVVHAWLPIQDSPDAPLEPRPAQPTTQLGAGHR